MALITYNYSAEQIKQLAGGGVPYKVISQIISQTGTSAPTVNREVENTTGTTFTWGRFGAGIYRLIAADPVFNQGGGNFFYTTTFANIGYPSSPNPIFISTSIQNDILFEINTFDKTGVLTDTGLNFATIEAHIYPVV